MDWTIDSLDWKYSKLPVDVAAKIIQNVLAGATSACFFGKMLRKVGSFSALSPGSP